MTKRYLDGLGTLRSLSIIRLCGFLASILGAVVLAGWHWKIELLIQIHPSFVPMQYNTALGFVMSGVVLIFIDDKFKKLKMVLSITLLTLGSLTLLEYLTGVDFGIDQLFMNHHITTETSHPGRMAPNTALCFFLTALSSIVFTRTVGWVRISGALSSLIFGIALVSLMGYAIGKEEIYGWGKLTQMAIHTSLGFIVLGLGLTLSSLRSDKQHLASDQHGSKPWFFGYAVSLALTIFMADLSVPTGYSAGVPYILLVLLSWFSHHKLVPYLLAGISTMLIILGWMLSPTNVDGWALVANRSFAILAVWSVAGLLRSVQAKEKGLTLLNIELMEKAETLEITKNKFQGAFQHSANGMALISPEGNWLKVNKRVTEITGYTEDELKSQTFQNITHPDDLTYSIEHVQQLLNGELQSYQIEKRYFHKNGHIVHILLSVSLVRNSHGKPVHFVSQIKDITAQINDKAKLDETLRQLKGHNDRLLNFAHIVSHNLRSHTGNLMMMMGFIKEKGLENGEKEKILVHIDGISEAMHDTVTHLTEVVKIQTDLNKESVKLNLSNYADRALKALSAQLTEANANVKNKIDPKHSVLFNSAYLDSVLLNLISNSIKYRDPLKEFQVTLESDKIEGTQFFSVSDNGLGIDLERYGHQLFVLNKTFHEHEDSRGVGLFITKNQIEAFEGQIEVESQPLVGTTFKISMPYED